MRPPRQLRCLRCFLRRMQWMAQQMLGATQPSREITADNLSEVDERSQCLAGGMVNQHQTCTCQSTLLHQRCFATTTCVLCSLSFALFFCDSLGLWRCSQLRRRTGVCDKNGLSQTATACGRRKHPPQPRPWQARRRLYASRRPHDRIMTRGKIANEYTAKTCA